MATKRPGGRSGPISAFEGRIEVVERATQVDVSIVIPCLDEAETIGTCVSTALRALRSLGIEGEVVVADNGSTDGSAERASEAGARVVAVSQKGYGSALRGGIDAARGEYVIMGDGDGSYDFSAIGPFLQALGSGADLVMGNRFLGEIAAGAMPWLNRWIGNPFLTFLGRLFFRTKIGDFHCGLRAFRQESYRRMGLSSVGMEFATEMVVKSVLAGLATAEIPIVLRPDGRSRRSHLRPWRDGWRHLRFMLLWCPLWLFFIPGLVQFLPGLLGVLWLTRAPRRLGGVELDIHTLLFASSLCILGFDLLLFGAVIHTVGIAKGVRRPLSALGRVARLLTLERGVVLGIALCSTGLVHLSLAFAQWHKVLFGHLDPRVTMRLLIPATTLLVLGCQCIFGSFLLSVLSMRDGGRPD
jgi:glycosyltransferase involved in cell wall biosynthesis